MAKKLPIVHCRCCKGDIDRSSTQEGVDWIMRSRGWYYHKNCFDDWVAAKNEIHAMKRDEEWKDYAWEFLTREIKIGIEYPKFNSQWENFVKKKMTSKGIYFALKYFYEVQKGDKTKAQGGIGIVPHIYPESCSYWIERESQESGIIEKITQQLREKAETEENQEVKVQIRKKKTKKAKFSLDMVEGGIV